MKPCLTTLFAALIVSLGEQSIAAGKSKPVESHIPVSLVEVLVNPAPLRNERIRVAGYLGDDLQLYLSTEYATAFDVESSLTISSEISDEHGNSTCKNNFVSVVGKLVEDKPGQYLLKDISRIYVSKTKQFCYERKAS